MADSRASALAALSLASIAGTDLVYVVDVSAGTGHKVTLDDLVAYIEQRGRQHNASVAQQTGFAADTYLTGSDVAIPQGKVQAKTKYWCKFNVVKTGAGVATPIINLRVGTAATTADASRGTLTFSAQTAVIDEGTFEVQGIFRTAGATAVLQSLGQLSHRLSITGLGVGVSEPEIATSAAFDVTGAGLKIGLSVNGGASAAWTINVVDAMLSNLA